MGTLFRADDLAATMPAAPDPGLAEGYLADPDIGAGTPGSKWHAYYLEYLRACLHGGITALGGTPDIDDPDAFADAIDALDWEDRISTLEGYGDGAQGIISHATDTGVVSTTHTRTVVASNASQSTGECSANVACYGGCIASGDRSANVACSLSCTASGVRSANVASYQDCTASGIASANVGCAVSCTASGNVSANVASTQATASATRTATIASLNIENATANSLALGYDAGAAITPNGTDQNISIHLKAIPGQVYASGGLDLGYGKGTCSSNAVTINAVSGRITTESLTTAAGAYQDITLTNDKCDANSLVFCTVVATTGTGIPIVERVATPTATTRVIRIRNIDPAAAFNSTIALTFVVFNPA